MQNSRNFPCYLKLEFLQQACQRLVLSDRFLSREQFEQHLGHFLAQQLLLFLLPHHASRFQVFDRQTLHPT